MAELLCENDCTKHTVQLDSEDKQLLSNFVVDYKFDSATYDEIIKEIVIKLVDEAQ